MKPEDALDEVLRDAVRVRVTRPGGDLLLEVAGAETLDGLRRALAVGQMTDGFCMCHGDLAFAFLDGGGQPIAAVGFHHAMSLRWPGWDGDALLRDGGAVLRWLAGQGLGGPLREEQLRHGVRQDEQLAEQRWMAAAPAAVRDLLELAVVAAHTDGVIPAGVRRLIAERLAAAIPDPVERTVALLSWYGSGTGRLSGHPVHEELPAPMLAATPVAHLVEALRAEPAVAEVDAGAVRHLCGWRSRPHQARDIAQVPGELRARLLRAAGGDDGERRLAERWLGDSSQRS